MKKHVFISYVHEDAEHAIRLSNELADYGIQVWLDRKDIAPGVRWRFAIRKAINDGAFFIACFSTAYTSRERSYMNEELSLAIEQLRQMQPSQSWFIPIKLSECEIPSISINAVETLNDIQYVGLYPDWSKGFQRILSVILPNEIEAFDNNVRRTTAIHSTEDELLNGEQKKALNVLTNADLPGDRILAAKELGSHRPCPKPIIDALVERLGDKNQMVASICHQILLDIGEPAKDSLVNAIFYSKKDEPRRRSAELLARLGKSAISPLISCLGRKSTSARGYAAMALSLMKPPPVEAIEPLILAFENNKWPGPHKNYSVDVRFIRKALLNMEQDAIPFLLDSLNSFSEGVRAEVIDTLAEINQPSKQAVDALMNAIEDENMFIRTRAIDALGSIGEMANISVNLLIKIAKSDPQERMRSSAVHALKRIGSPLEIVLPVVLQSLTDSHPWVRSSAIDAITNIGRPAAPQGIPALLKFLTTGLDSSSHSRIIKIVESLGTPTNKCEQLLDSLLDHPNPEIKNYAKTTLMKIRKGTEEL